MIDKIEITLDDSGLFVVNIGDVQITHVETPIQAGGLVGFYAKKLAYFPNGIEFGSANSITFEEFKKRNKIK